MVSTAEILSAATTNQPATDDTTTCFRQLPTSTTTTLERRQLPEVPGASGDHRTATNTIVWYHYRTSACADDSTPAICIALLLSGTAAPLGSGASKFAGHAALILNTPSRKSASNPLVCLADTRRYSISRLGCTLWRLSGNCDARFRLVITHEPRYIPGIMCGQ
jgi:hypothetical protein